MKLFIEIQSGSSFEIEVDNSDTLLKIKQKIEKSHHIPVSQQRIIFDGISIVREDLNLEQCQILHKSRIQINVSPNHSPIHNNDHMFHQTEECLGSSMSAEEYLEMQGWPLTTEELNKIYSYRPETMQQSPPSEEINKSHQDNLTVTLHQLSSSKSVKENVKNKIVNMKKPMTVGSTNPVKSLRDMLNLPQEGFLLRHNGKVLNDDQSFEMNRIHQNDRIEIVELEEPIIKSHQDLFHQQPSSSKSVSRGNIKEDIWRFMITVFVVSNSGEKKPVTMARTARVKVLKEVLNLPKHGFVFTHKGRVLNQNQSFSMNSIRHNDTIEIVALNS